MARLAYGSAVIKASNGKVLDVEVKSLSNARQDVIDGSRLVREAAEKGIELPFRLAVVRIIEET
jgi:hypothetical protein